MNSQEVPLLVDIDGRKDYQKNAVNVFLVIYSDDKEVLRTLLEKLGISHELQEVSYKDVTGIP